MQKQMLRCDICGGELEMQGGGKAVCASCGMKYSTESLREKFNGLKVSVTGSRDDVAQWKELANRYLEMHDFVAAEGVIKKILEAAPSDEFANTLYAQLQSWKYCEIINGRLIKYSGKQTQITLPTGISEVCDHAFARNTDITSVVIPDGVIRIGEEAFTWTKLTNIILPESVKEIGKGAFSHCLQLKSVILPQKLEEIGYEAFASCVSLETIDMPESIKELGGFAFSDCIQLKGTLTFPSIETIGDGVFCGCRSLKKIILGNNLKQVGQNAFMFHGLVLPRADRPATQIERIEIEYHGDLDFSLSTEEGMEKLRQRNEQERISKEQSDRRSRGRCPYCGGEFKGILIKVCRNCGKTKDY